MPFDEAAAIEHFWEARRSGVFFPAEWRDRLDFDRAYRIQLGVIARRVAAGERQAGWKVAQTSAAGRAAFGFAEPLFGCVMSDGVRRSGHVYAADALIEPRCEAELCFRLAEPLSGAVGPEAARRAVGELFPAMEMIEVRGDIAGQKALAIADNSATKDIVLGAPVPLSAGLDLAAAECRVLLNGAEAARGLGREVMGDPVNALVWLAAKLAGFGLALRPGDLVMTGSLTRPLPLAPGDHVRTEFAGFGAVEVSVSRRPDRISGVDTTAQLRL